MPALKKKYYGTTDIMTVLGCSRSKATTIMHMFDARGQLLRDKRLLRVKISDFEEWEKEGYHKAG